MKYVAQPAPRIDAEIVKPGTHLEEVGLSPTKKKDHFCIETN